MDLIITHCILTAVTSLRHSYTFFSGIIAVAYQEKYFTSLSTAYWFSQLMIMQLLNYRQVVIASREQ